jgi:hypothetical protein
MAAAGVWRWAKQTEYGDAAVGKAGMQAKDEAGIEFDARLVS